MKIFEKKKCFSINSKCSETYRNAKTKFYPYDRLRAERRSAKPERRIGLVFLEVGKHQRSIRGNRTIRQTEKQTNKQNHRTTNPIDPPLPEGSKKTN